MTIESSAQNPGGLPPWEHLQATLQRAADLLAANQTETAEFKAALKAEIEAECEAVTYAKKKGLFVIRATGKSASIVNEQNFKPRLFAQARG